ARLHQAWLESVTEEVIDPELPIVDPHHHLWSGFGGMAPHQPDYLEADLTADLASGHRVAATIYMECSWAYRSGGPAALRPVGETETVNAIAGECRRSHPGGTAICAGIIGFADLCLGAAVGDVLEAHRAAAPRRFSGIRHNTAWDEN